jgi:hypothetical protein
MMTARTPVRSAMVTVEFVAMLLTPRDAKAFNVERLRFHFNPVVVTPFA